MRRGIVATLAVLALTATGCGSGGTGGSGSGGDGLDWTATADPVGAADGLAWGDRQTGTLHLPGDTTLDAGRAIESFVVAGDGAYALPDEGDDLLRVSADGAEETGAHADDVRASPDGRYLVYLDPDVGKKDRYGTPLLTVVVVDLEKGDEVYRSSRAMGDTKDDDLADLYEDAEPGLLGISDDTAWIDAPTGVVLSVDLASGEAKESKDAATFEATQPWMQPRVDDDLNGGDLNADESWGITRLTKVTEGFVSADGTKVTPKAPTPTWTLERWVGPDTAVGVAVDAEPTDEGTFAEDAAHWLITCTVPSGACTTVPGSDRGAPQFVLPTPSLS